MNTNDIRERVVSALKEKTRAGERVYSPRDWPTSEEMYPVILVQTPHEEKKSLGNAAPEFTVTTTVEISVRTQQFDGTENDGAMQALAELEVLRDEVEKAVINSYDLTRQIQQFSAVRSSVGLDAGGEGHMALLLIQMDIEYYQGPEDFCPAELTDMDAVDVTISMPDGTTRPLIHTDLT
ncbi:ATP-binding protein [Salmonella enterica]|nr:ATP-binding protein [Salmonella enterica]EGL7479606.1 ATP-binding protein [Salmonella enterica]EIZ2335792.1 ATP-binding protein [Salmonella enterica]